MFGKQVLILQRGNIWGLISTKYLYSFTKRCYNKSVYEVVSVGIYNVTLRVYRSKIECRLEHIYGVLHSHSVAMVGDVLPDFNFHVGDNECIYVCYLVAGVSVLNAIRMLTFMKKYGTRYYVKGGPEDAGM